MNFLSSVFEKTFKEHPYLFLFMVLYSGMLTGHYYNIFAQEKNVDLRFNSHLRNVELRFTSISNNIQRLDESVNVQFSQQTIRQINSEIYDLSNLINSGEANRRDHARLKDLQDDLLVENRKLSNIHN